MLIFLYGPDTFRLSQKLDQIIEEYKKHVQGLDFSVFDAAYDKGKDFFYNLRQNSLFQEKKFFVVKNPITNKEFKDSLIDNIKTVADSGHNIVFCQEGKVLKTDRLLSAFKKFAKIQEFAFLEDNDLDAWIIGEFKKLGRPINLQTARTLSRLVGNDLWRAQNEIQKLMHFIVGREITVLDVVQNVSPEIDANIFGTIDAAANRDKKQAFKLIRDHLQKGDHPLYLLATIATQFKNLLLVKSGGNLGAARLGIHPYVFSKTIPQARRFGLEELKNIYRKIVQVDFDVKTGKIAPEVGLDLLIAQL